MAAPAPACHIRYRTATATDCWLTYSAIRNQNGCRQVCNDHLAGKDRHNYGYEMKPVGLPVSLPSRLTESTVWSEDRIWLGLDSYLAELVGSP